MQCKHVANVAGKLIQKIEFFAPVADLGIRLWAAKFFWDSGLTKINLDGAFPFIHLNDSTLSLFMNEYHVPLLSPVLAAYLGTAIELTFPVLLALGLGGRIAATVLFVFNIAAVVSYPALEEFGVAQHMLYGTLLLLPMLRGPGAISIDHVIRRRCIK
jgi:putative oxidoreductase